MKKTISFLLFIFCILHFALCTYATELKGGVTYTVDSARKYVQEGLEANANILGPYLLQVDNVEKIVYSRNNNGDVVGITVQYKGEPNKAYIYDSKNRLIYVDKYDKPVNIYPHRGYRYNLDGKLILTSLTVSKTEMFRFDPQGKLIAHSINGIIYDEDGNIIGNGK